MGSLHYEFRTGIEVCSGVFIKGGEYLHSLWDGGIYHGRDFRVEKNRTAPLSI